MTPQSAPHNRAAFSTRVSSTGWSSNVERLITFRTSLVAVCCSSASLSSALAAASSRVRASTFCSRVAYDSSSRAAVRLNSSPRASSSSPVRTWIRCPRSPAPIRAAIFFVVGLGLSVLASVVLARQDREPQTDDEEDRAQHDGALQRREHL